MKYLGKINSDKDLVTKEYTDSKVSEASGVLNSRISNLINEITNNPEYAPTAEVVDIRSGYDGTVHSTAGDAVRSLGYKIADMQGELEQYVDAHAVDGLLYEDNKLYLTSGGVPVSDPIEIVSGSGGGGSGGSDNNAILTVTNTTGWITKTFSSGSDCIISFSWSSLEQELSTGNGILTIKVDNNVKRIMEIQQGDISVNIADYLTAGSNKIRFSISDIYDNVKSITFTVTIVSLSITSLFDASQFFSSEENITYTYIPTGTVEKTVYFIVDGETYGTSTVTVSGRQQSFILSNLLHGAHTLRVYFTATINGETVSSNSLYYEFIVVDPNVVTPIIASPFIISTVPQYTTLAIPYTVYTPNSISSVVSFYDGNTEITSLTIDRTEHIWNYRVNNIGSTTLSIKTGNVVRSFAFEVVSTDIDIHAETNQLALYLSSYGRSNNEEHPEVWKDEDNDISCVFTNFGFVSDGWVTDSDNITVLRVSGDARVTIPYKPFANDFRITGKTIEIEFATRDILNYDSTIISCMNGDRGFQLSAQKAVFKSEQSEISMQYKEDEHIRVSFVVEKRSENRLVYIYINGIMSGVIQYPNDDNFAQLNPVNITIGSNQCTTDIYCIRIYDNDLTRYQILDNWIADTQDLMTLLERYEHNDVYDPYGYIVIDKLPNDLPYMILDAPELPQYKGDKKTITGQYVDPVVASNSFTFSGCQINVQGTSSAPYARKNYDMQFKEGFEMSGGIHADNYALAPMVVPFNRFVLKADVASSESANNVELVKLYCDINPYIRPERVQNNKVRDGIYGFPIVVFWHDTVNDTVTLLGKYNFNLPKRAPGPYGYSGDMESWEFQNNTSDLMIFKSDYFDETMYTDPSTGDTKELWRYDYEARFPSDEWTDYSKLQEFQSFIYSTYRANATNDALSESVIYDGVTYTNDTADYRLAKFKAEFVNYAEVDSFIFYYIFTELFLMVDSRAKNLFIGFSGSQTSGLNVIDRKAVAEPYDMDTAIGTNNEGSLVFGYSIEDTDTLESGANVFNGQESVLWCNIRDAFTTEIVAMYQRLRSIGTLSFANVEKRFEDHQAKWPEAIFNEDAIFKYIMPLTEPDPGKQPTAVYLPMLQGSKAEQRKWWLYNRFRYMDSKWNAGDALQDTIQIRGYNKADITVTPYADIYPTVKYGSYLVSQRGHRGTATTLECPLSTVNDTEIYIYSASQLSSIGDLSGLKIGFADFSNAIRLQNLKIGDSDSQYDNGNLTDLTLGNNTLLQSIDVRNCSNLSQAVDLSGCSNIEYVYFGGTAITGCTLPNGGILKTLQLPGTVTNLTIRNQPFINNFDMESYQNITTLRIENVSNAIPIENIINGATNLNRVRLINIDWTSNSEANLQSAITKLINSGGLDENGNNIQNAVLTGYIRVATISDSLLNEIYSHFPEVVVIKNNIPQYLVRFMNGNSVVYSMIVASGGHAVDPVANGYCNAPTKEPTDGNYYVFSNWSSIPTNVHSSVNVYAEFVTKYRVRFLNYDGSELQTFYVFYGESVTYSGQTPTKPATIQNVYTFSSWSEPTNDIQESIDVIAQYTSSVRTYTVYYYNDSTLLETVSDVPYGSSAVYSGSTPINSDPDYTFVEFIPDGTNIVGDTYCYATFADTAPLTVKYLRGTLANYESDTIVAIADYAFYGRKEKLKTVKTSATSIGSYSFSGCENLYEVDLTNTSSVAVSTYAFANSIRLKDLIIRSESLSILDSTNQFLNTIIANGYGAIYVPSNLVDSYKNSSNWSAYSDNIYSIERYPITDYSTISDTWDEILNNPNYFIDYHVGDTKMLTVFDGENYVSVYMQIAAIDADELSDNTGNAKITWICTSSLYIGQKMYNSTSVSKNWDETSLRNWLYNTIYQNLPANIKSEIKEVNKTYYSTKISSTNVASDYIWIPSNREVFGGVAYESYGVVYSGLFANANSRIRRVNGTAWIRPWWLRTGYSSGKYCVISTSGSSSYSDQNSNSEGIVFGFCT